MEKQIEAITVKYSQRRQSPAHSNGRSPATGELDMTMTLPAWPRSPGSRTRRSLPPPWSAAQGPWGPACGSASAQST
eukprot:961572-Alexandrium_andersonii.AAC.1